MNQIYNLAQTIAADKDTITKLEKHLLNAKNILAAHENAMERLTTVPSVIVSEKGIGAARGSVREGNPVLRPEANYTRITYLNNQDLAIMEGDLVEVIINGDPDIEFEGLYVVADTATDSIVPFYLDDRGRAYWYEFDECNDESELYLIRTPEGSLNK